MTASFGTFTHNPSWHQTIEKIISSSKTLRDRVIHEEKPAPLSKGVNNPADEKDCFNASKRLKLDAKMYTFLVYLNILNDYYYRYSQLEGSYKIIIDEENRKAINLIKNFRKYYTKRDDINQLKILIEISERIREVEKYINLIPIEMEFITTRDTYTNFGEVKAYDAPIK